MSDGRERGTWEGEKRKKGDGKERGRKWKGKERKEVEGGEWEQEMREN